MFNLRLLALLLFSGALFSQTNITVINSTVDDILKGNYNPSNYSATTVINDHSRIACMLDDELSSDSLLSYLEVLGTFHTRHTYSDTVSATMGIGAARRWIRQKLNTFSSRNDNRLQTGYLQFDQPTNTCGPVNGLRNVLGVLPGTDPSKPLLFVEGHMDSRCESRCDDTCFAAGIDDNASGTALVMELARVMSRYTFDHTIVFMLTTGEEQGLLGAAAMAEYCLLNNLEIKAVQNNDVTGGIVCGQTASPPGCDPAYSVDSTTVRLYASPSFLQPHQGFARTIKMYYEEKMKPQARVPMDIDIINQEDRIGRGGDHIPFRIRGYTNVRFCSANEHGDAGVSDPNYGDHQHTGRDVLGMDNNNDGLLDTFYVDVNYLRRNALINGVSLTMLALGPESPSWQLNNDPTGAKVEILNGVYPEYRVGVRTAGGQTDFDAVYRFSGSTLTIPGLQSGVFYFISVSAIDANGIMSPFTREERLLPTIATTAATPDSLPYSIDCFLFSIREKPGSTPREDMRFISVSPNPVSKMAIFNIELEAGANTANTKMAVIDNLGREIDRFEVQLNEGSNRIEYETDLSAGAYFVQLWSGDDLVKMQKMVVQ